MLVSSLHKFALPALTPKIQLNQESPWPLDAREKADLPHRGNYPMTVCLSPCLSILADPSTLDLCPPIHPVSSLTHTTNWLNALFTACQVITDRLRDGVPTETEYRGSIPNRDKCFHLHDNGKTSSGIHRASQGPFTGQKETGEWRQHLTLYSDDMECVELNLPLTRCFAALLVDDETDLP